MRRWTRLRFRLHVFLIHEKLLMGHPMRRALESEEDARDRIRRARRIRDQRMTARTDGREEVYACLSCKREASILRLGPLKRCGHLKHLFCASCRAYLMHEKI